MIDVTGPFLLVLTYGTGIRPAGIAVHEMRDQASCEAAIVQLEPVIAIRAYCIAATVTDGESHD